MRGHLAVAVLLTVMVIAASLMAIGLVCRTIALHPDAMGFIVTPAEAAVDPKASSPQLIDIDNDGGGNVMKYYEHYKELSNRGATIRIHGYCASACTMILFREYTGIKACVADPDAVFAFHKPYAFDKSHSILKTKTAVRISRELWAMMLVEMPYDAYKILKDARIPSATEGDSPDDVFVVPAIFFIPKCEAVPVS